MKRRRFTASPQSRQRHMIAKRLARSISRQPACPIVTIVDANIERVFARQQIGNGNAMQLHEFIARLPGVTRHADRSSCAAICPLASSR